MYDAESFLVPNPLDRYDIADWMPLQYNPDGSLDVHIEKDSPGRDKEANWLPRTGRRFQRDHARVLAEARHARRNLDSAADRRDEVTRIIPRLIRASAILAACLSSWPLPAPGQTSGAADESVPPASAKPSAEELAKLKQNPVSGLRQVIANVEAAPYVPGPGEMLGAYELPVVWPFALAEDWRLITYSILPVIQLPETDQEDPTVGLGDTLINLFVSPREPGALAWGAGPALLLPTVGARRRAERAPSQDRAPERMQWDRARQVSRALWSLDSLDSRRVGTRWLRQPAGQRADRPGRSEDRLPAVPPDSQAQQ
jgi:hypothetical protein